MTTKDFLKPKNFKIKAKSIKFETTEYITDLEKAKLYVSFVKLLNNHFKFTLFNKNLYQHFSTHCGFIAHYNRNGFYGEYFETAAKYHFNVNGYINPSHECSGNLNESSSLSHRELFYNIYKELNGMREGIGAFYSTIMSNQNWGAYSDYKDLDGAIKDAFNEYLEIWREEIRKAIKAKDQFEQISDDINELDKSNNKEIKKEKIVKKQQSLFDFAA